MSLTHLSLFSGIGGLDLAAEWAGFETVAQIEKDPFCRAVLARHWPNVPKFEDIHNVTADALRSAGIAQPPTVLSGGFPCQPFSCAGKRKGAEDDRYLWPEMLRVVQQSRPSWVVGENVAGFNGLALDETLAGLERAGYACRAFVFPAEAVGAPHLRYRCFIVANSQGERCIQRGLPLGEGEEIAVSGLSDPYGSDAVCSGQMRPCVSVRPGGSLKTASNSCRICEAVSYPLCAGWAEFNSPAISAKEGYAPWRADPFGLLWTDEPDVGRVADGVPSRVDRGEALGNAVVPQQAFPLFAAIAAIETGAIA